MNKYSLNELQEIIEHEKYLRKENQELYEENQQLKKQKDDVVEYIKEAMYSDSLIELPSGEITDIAYCIPAFEDILRMLGEEK